MSARAVFLDRDGVLNEVVERNGKTASPRSADELRIASGAAEALGELKAAGFRLFVVTNQPDIARGLMSQEALDGIHGRLRAALPLEAIQVCPHDDPQGCGCRKPKSGLVLELARRHDLDLRSSWLVGDQARDIACGSGAGVRTVLLRRPYNVGAAADVVAPTLLDASKAIIAASPLE